MWRFSAGEQTYLTTSIFFFSSGVFEVAEITTIRMTIAIIMKLTTITPMTGPTNAQISPSVVESQQKSWVPYPSNRIPTDTPTTTKGAPTSQ